MGSSTCERSAPCRPRTVQRASLSLHERQCDGSPCGAGGERVTAPSTLVPLHPPWLCSQDTLGQVCIRGMWRSLVRGVRQSHTLGRGRGGGVCWRRARLVLGCRGRDAL